MSEADWRAFLAADGVEDWVVLHGGPTAVFRVGSMVEGARFAEAIAAVPDLGPKATLTLDAKQVTVRLTRGVYRIRPEEVEAARRISAIARDHGVTAVRAAAQEVQLAIAAKPDLIDIGFWRAVLGYEPLAADNSVDPLGIGSAVWMQDIDPAKPLRHAMHIDVSLAREEAERRRDAAVAAGGRIVDDSNAPGSWILADRSGNKVCIAAWPDGAPTPGWAEPEADPGE
ncbi:MAG TPA: VOC family protein [Candidatus Limnocylindrales bacterium]|jgi:4a-hydroxytetrahydrobiopterin dehydratase|nr:VOC family protein [Candidatus Limnocylindrales bacterium]